VAAGNGQVTVSWPQVFTQGLPSSYSVTATPGGQSCTVMAPGQAFPTASCTFNGLTNGTSYSFVVTAINPTGSAQSPASSVVTPVAQLNGSCGAATGVQTLVAPTGLLCGAGVASSVASLNGTFTWSCTGTGGGSIAQCQAPGAASGGSTQGVVTLSANTGASACNLNQATQAAPIGGAPAGVVLPYGATSFSLVACDTTSGNARATVRLTYSSIVEGLEFWKFVNNSQHTGWVQMPANQVAMTGNTVTLDIVDNGEWDSDPAIGYIADPGGPGYSASAPPVVSGVPANVRAVGGNQSATVSWNAPSIGGAPVRYVVTANTGQSCVATHPQTSCTIAGLTNGTAYTFTVVAENAAGSSAVSVPSTPVTPQPNPTPPPNPIPTLSEWAQFIMSLLLLIGMGWTLRGRGYR